jgi:outer membrane lipoprotein-sorting protein
MKKNVSWLLQVVSLTVALFFVAPLMTNAQAGKANFSGTWVFNAEKSTMPEGGGGFGGQRMGGGDMTITQDASTLTQSRAGRDGTTRETKYVLDGKENVISTGRGDTKYTATWAADGKSLTLVTKMSFNGNEMTSTAVWSLKDAKTLAIETTRQSPNGEVKTTMVYDKK